MVQIPSINGPISAVTIVALAMDSSPAVACANPSLDPQNGSLTDTNQWITRAVGPFDLKAGDRVLLMMREEASNPNVTANGFWTVTGTQSEHWSLPVMIGWGIKRQTGAPALGEILGGGAGSGTWVRRQTAENFDNAIHHKVVDSTEWDVVTVDQANAYYATVIYFASSDSYRQAGSNMIVEQSDYGKLSAVVFRP